MRTSRKLPRVPEGFERPENYTEMVDTLLTAVNNQDINQIDFLFRTDKNGVLFIPAAVGISLGSLLHANTILQWAEKRPESLRVLIMLADMYGVLEGHEKVEAERLIDRSLDRYRKLSINPYLCAKAYLSFANVKVFGVDWLGAQLVDRDDIPFDTEDVICAIENTIVSDDLLENIFDMFGDIKFWSSSDAIADVCQWLTADAEFVENVKDSVSALATKFGVIAPEGELLLTEEDFSEENKSNY